MRGSLKFLLGLFLVIGSLGVVLSFVPWIGVEIQGKHYGVGHSYCGNAFGHKPDITCELRIDKASIPLFRIPKHCTCVLCRLHTKTAGGGR